MNSYDLKENELKIIDSYNKLKLIVNLFQNFTFKLNDKDKDLINFYEEIYSLHLINNKIFIKENEENINNSLLFCNKNDKFEIDENKFNNMKARNLSLKLLSLFEDEVKKFLNYKNNSKLFNKNKKSLITEQETLKNLKISFDEIYSLLNKNFELINEIYENFKFKEIENNNNYSELLHQENFLKIKDSLDNFMSMIFNEITSEQNFKVLESIKNKLIDEQNNFKLEIKQNKEKLNEYLNQGEELSNLVKEYKKICNLIECKKNFN